MSKNQWFFICVTLWKNFVENWAKFNEFYRNYLYHMEIVTIWIKISWHLICTFVVQTPRILRKLIFRGTCLKIRGTFCATKRLLLGIVTNWLDWALPRSESLIGSETKDFYTIDHLRPPIWFCGDCQMWPNQQICHMAQCWIQHHFRLEVYQIFFKKSIFALWWS